MSTVRFRCTKETPWDQSKGTPVDHVDAVETDEDSDFGGGEYCVLVRCPNCGHSWWQELPQ